MPTMEEDQERQKSKVKRLDVYDRQPYPPEVQYEVTRLPLQGYIGTARLQLKVGWKAGQERWWRFQLSVKKAVTTTRTQAQDKLKSVGVTNPAALARYGAIGGAALTGYIIARKRSLFRRLLYTTLGASAVAGTIYFSSAQRRSEFWEKMNQVWHGYRDSVTQWTHRKNTPASKQPTSSDNNDNSR